MATVSIPLTQDKFTLIDEEDYDLVSQHKWYAKNMRHGEGTKFYAARTLPLSAGGKTQLLHRLLLGAPKHVEVDHINGDGLDNRRSNLRLCTHAENCRNQSRRSGRGSSQFKGVMWVQANGKWRVMIGDNGQTVDLGRFTDEIEAAKAYDRAARKIYGEFARLNFPDDDDMRCCGTGSG